MAGAVDRRERARRAPSAAIRSAIGEELRVVLAGHREDRHVQLDAAAPTAATWRAGAAQPQARRQALRRCCAAGRRDRRRSSCEAGEQRLRHPLVEERLDADLERCVPRAPRRPIGAADALVVVDDARRRAEQRQPLHDVRVHQREVQRDAPAEAVADVRGARRWSTASRSARAAQVGADRAGARRGREVDDARPRSPSAAIRSATSAPRVAGLGEAVDEHDPRAAAVHLRGERAGAGPARRSRPVGVTAPTGRPPSAARARDAGASPGRTCRVSCAPGTVHAARRRSAMTYVGHRGDLALGRVAQERLHLVARRRRCRGTRAPRRASMPTSAAQSASTSRSPTSRPSLEVRLQQPLLRARPGGPVASLSHSSRWASKRVGAQRTVHVELDALLGGRRG